MIVNIDEFLHKYTTPEWQHGSFIPSSIQTQMACAETAFIEIPDNIETLMLMQKEENILRDAEYAEISFHRNKGMESERTGDYEGALEQYLESIHIGESSQFDMLHAYRISYDRAIALARLLNIEYLERELIEGLMKHSLAISDRIKLSERLTSLSA